MEVVVFILVFVVLWAWIEIVRSKQAFGQQIQTLLQRVWTLEKQVEKLREARVEERIHPVAHEPAPQPAAHATPPPIPVTPVVPEVTPAPPPAVHIAEPAPAFMEAAAPPPVPPRPRTPPPPAAKPARAARDWEAIIGGDFLNKIGALLLVIGIMSFLAYYSTQMGPAGRAGCAVLVSLSLLGTGVWLERKDTYRSFARGLIGAGWAALYATAYAIYALPAARIIENPFLGSCVVLLVAGGMIAHSLRYRSQAVTAVAFFSAFAALAVTPSAPFGVVSLIPLAAAVLYLAQRFDWYHMALMGVFATYGSCAWHGSSNAPLVETETLFLFYWALFEMFDLMRFSRSLRGWSVELVFPLNAAGFLGLSYASWTNKSPDTVWLMSAIAATLFLVSTLWRLKIELDRGMAEGEDLATRARAGTYEAPLVLGAFMAATAIVQKLTGMWMSTALALEAQALFTLGVRFRMRFLRALSCAGFLVSLAYLADSAARGTGGGHVNILGHTSHTWVVIALFHAMLFYVNRAMSEAKSVIGTGFSWAGMLLVALVLTDELPPHLVGTGWLLLGTVLFELGLRKKLMEFRWQAYLIGLLGAWSSLVIYKPEVAWPWFPLAFGTAFTLAATWRVSLLEKSDAGNREWQLVGWFACGLNAMFAPVLIIKEVPDQYVGLPLWGLALVMLELGIRRLPARMRVFSYPIAALATLATVGSASKDVVKFAAPHVWSQWVGAAVVAWIMSARLSVTSEDIATPLERNEIRSILSGIGLILGMVALWIVVPDEFLPAAWAALGLAALEAGNALSVRAYRWEGQTIALFAALSAFGLTLSDGHAHRILAIALLVAVHVGFRFLSPAGVGIEGKAPLLHEGASAVLVAALLYQEVSGGLLTTAWGTEALVLLGTGFVFRERPLRLDGLGMFLVCVLKLFLYDLRNLETPYRILSFIALGLILLGVSWVYTRFREQLQKLL